MAGKIKGLTVVIDGETTKLSRAISSVNTQTRSLQRELKGCTTLLEKDPTNLDLITQKQKLLTTSLTEQKSKLQMLKDAEAQYYASATKHTEEEEKEFRNLQREIASTESKIESLTKECIEFGTSASASSIAAKEQLNKYATACEAAGKHLLVASAAVTAFGVAAVKSYAEVEEGAKAVINATGATGEAAEELIGVYKDVAEDVVGSFDSIGGAVGEVNTRFGFTGEELEKCSESFVKFADITGTDAVTAVQLVSRYMGDAGVEAEDYGIVLDQLAVAAQASGISVDKLAESCTKYGAPMRALGFDTQESIAIFSTWEKAGVNTEIAFSGMKKAISNWSAEGKDAREEFKLMLEEIANCPDIATATTKAIEVFGAKAGPDLADAIQGGRFEYSEMLALIEGSQGALESTYKEWEEGTNKGAKALQNLKLTTAEFGGTVIDMAAPAMETLTEIMQEVSEWWQNLDEDAKKNVVSMAGIVAAAGPATLALGKLFGAASKIVGTYNSAKTALDLWNQGLVATKIKQGEVIDTMDKVTAKAKLQTVALNAAKAAAAALAIAAIALLISHLKNCYEEQVKFTQATEGLTDSFDAIDTSIGQTRRSLDGFSTEKVQRSFGELRKSIEETIERQAQLAQEFTDTWAEINGSSAAIESYMGTIEALTGKCDENRQAVALTAEEQAELRAAVAGVNEICGTNYEVIDATNGILSASTDAIRANADAWIANAEAQAAQEQMVELKKEEFQLQMDLVDAQDAYAAAQANVDRAVAEGRPISQAEMNDLAAKQTALEKQQALVDANAESQAKLTKIVGESQEELEGTVTAISDYIGASESWQAVLEDTPVDIEALSLKLHELGFTTSDLANLTDEQIKVMASCYEGGLDEIIAACEKAGIAIPEEMKGAVEGSAEAIEEGTPANVAAAENLTGKVEGEVSGLEGSMGAAAEAGTEAFAQSLENGEDDAEAAAANLNQAVSDKMDLYDEFRGAGQDALRGLISGFSLSGNLGRQLSSSVTNVGTTVLNRFNSTVGRRSPWKTMVEAAKDGVLGLSVGFDKYSYLAEEGAERLGDSTLSAMDNTLSAYDYGSALDALGRSVRYPHQQFAQQPTASVSHSSSTYRFGDIHIHATDLVGMDAVEEFVQLIERGKYT